MDEERTGQKEKFKPFRDKATAWIGAVAVIITTLFAISDRCKPPKESGPHNQETNIFIESQASNETKEPEINFAQKETADKKEKSQIEEPINNKPRFIYRVRMLVNEDLKKVDKILCDGKQAEIIKWTNNMLIIGVPELGRSYNITVMMNETIVKCPPVYVEKNNQKVALNCRLPNN